MTQDISPKRAPIAVVGVSAIFPGSIESRGFWKDILAGSDLITDVPPSHWLIEDYYDPDPSAPDKTYARRGAFLPKVDFDSMGWGVPPSIVPETDTSQLLGLIVAQQVLEDACGSAIDTIDRSRISCILGVTSGQELLGSMVSRLQRPIWVKALRESGLPEDEVQSACDRISANYTPWKESTFPGLLGNVVAGRIANRLDLGGTNCVTDAACASTFSALAMGVNELQLGDSDMVITGGVDTMNDIFMYMCFSKTPALSATGDCRPFSDQADGTMLAEGIGMVALKRLADAERDGDRIYAVINGVGTSSDGRSKSVYAPVSKGQAKALTRAYDQAGYGPDSVELVEAHGTGTRAGDAAEVGGLQQAFDESGRQDRQWCTLGSVKSQMGHAKAAAGAAGLIKAILALHNKVLPPTIKVERPNPKLDLENSPFQLSTRARPWVRDQQHPRRASVSSFGFGGSNFHIALSEYTEVAGAAGQRAGRLRSTQSELVTLSASSAAALSALARETAEQCTKPGFLSWVARSSQQAFTADATTRLVVIASDEEQLASRLRQAADAINKTPDTPFSTPAGIHFGIGPQAATAGVALLFAGQGSQYLHMGADLAMQFERAIEPWDTAASKTWDPQLQLQQVVYPATAFTPEETTTQQATLAATEWAQPAIGCTSLSQLNLLRDLGLKADSYAGHSFGEVTALHAAGVISAADFLSIARKRGELMAAAAEIPGAMLAVSKPIEQLRDLLARWGSDVVVANHNAPDQVVLSGPSVDIEAVASRLSEEKISAKRLPVATAFHSPVVAAASEAFADYLADISFAKPAASVYSNTTGAAHSDDPDTLKKSLGTQLALPVRFVDMIEAMYASGMRTFVEVGPGAIQTGLVKRILGDRPHRAINLDRKGQQGLQSLHSAIATLLADGHALQLDALWQGYREPLNPHDRPQPKLTLKLDGANYGKPYPPPGGAKDLPAPNPPRPAAAQTDELPMSSVPAVEQAGANEAPTEAPTKVAPQLPHPATVAVTPATAPLAPEAGRSAQPLAAGAAPLAPDWNPAYQEAQRQTAEAHAAYLQAMTTSHSTFLDIVDRGFQALGGQLSNTMANPLNLALTSTTPSHQQHAFAPAPLTPTPAPTPAPSISEEAAPSPKAVVAPARPLAVPASAAAGAPGPDLQALMLTIVAEKTGYPAEMLSLDMNMEGDLGIDSIKRVEILATMSERCPGLPEVDTAAMAELQTLGQVVDYMNGLLGQSAAAPATAQAPAAAEVDLHGLMLTIVAEKTGYPSEMLDLGMALEGDLGIDSIKRVEILATMSERCPGLPEVDTAAMAELQTLGQVVDYMNGLLGQSTTTAAVTTQGQAPAAPEVDLHGLMLEIVAEKTGYPADMLSLDMNMEGDLGIDSIKRVEILATMSERCPGLPEVDTAAMAELQTLGQVVDYMNGLLGQSTTTAAVTTQGQAPAAPGVDLHGLMLEIVAEKTGYPADMLSLDMNMEGDLGIDSIKRVEILATMSERCPGLPEVDTAAMAELQTLGQVVDYMNGLLGQSSAPAATRPIAASETSASTSAPTLGRFTLEAVERPPMGLSQQGLRGSGTLLIIGAPTELGRELVLELGRHGIAAAQADQVNTAERKLQGVIYLGGLRTFTSAAAALAVNREAFEVARAAAVQLAGERAEHGLFITVQDTGGAFATSAFEQHQAWSAGLAGLARTVRQEWPNTSAKAIDLECAERTPAGLARAIADELIAGGPDTDVGLLACGRRVVLESRLVPVTSDAPSLSSGDVVVASGGARGVTAATLIALAGQSPLRFVLLGRSPLADEPSGCAGVADDAGLKRALLSDAQQRGEKVTPAGLGKQVRAILACREIRATLAAIQQAGSKARYETCDATDAAAVGDLLDTVRAEWGPIAGIVHGAGVLADKLIAEKTTQQFDRVFNTKIDGLRALLDATSADPLKMLCLFSSVAARCGNLGQCDYAMANEIFNKVAVAEARRRGETCLVKSLGWGPWEGGMVTPALQAHFESMGVPLIPLAEGAQMLVDELSCHAPGEIELVMGGEPQSESLHPSGKERVLTLEVSVGRDSHPYLEHHAIKGAPVVPVALVIEWFARSARAFSPKLDFAGLKDLEVIKGIALQHWEQGTDSFAISCRLRSNGNGAILVLELTGADGSLHYRCHANMVVCLDTHAAASSINRRPDVASLGLESWGERIIYDGDILFHGPDFQAVQTIDGISTKGIMADLHGIRSTSWAPALGGGDTAAIQHRWHTDPLALDGGLQLALLWCQHTLGGASLPTGIDEVRMWSHEPAEGRLRCTLIGRAASGYKSVSDLIFHNEQGEVVAELLGVKTHLLPAQAPASSGGKA